MYRTAQERTNKGQEYRQENGILGDERGQYYNMSGKGRPEVTVRRARKGVALIYNAVCVGDFR
jgi:hypothetical protein